MFFKLPFTRWALCVGVAASLCLPLLPANLQAVGKSGIPGYIVIPLGRGHNNRLVLTATIEGTKGLMVLDTGAPYTVLNASKYGKLQGEGHPLPPKVPKTVSMNGVSCTVVAGKDCVVGGQNMGPVTGILVPQRYINDQAALYDGDAGRQYDGLLGEDLLHGTRAVLDCAHLTLYMNMDPAKQFELGPELLRTGYTAIPMTRVAGHYTVPLTVNGHHFRMIVDTGAPLTTLDRGYMRGAGVSSRDLPISGGIIGTQAIQAALADTQTLQLGNYHTASSYLLTRDRIAEDFNRGGLGGGDAPIIGLLGGDLLAKNLAFIDVGHEKLYLKPGGGKK